MQLGFLFYFLNISATPGFQISSLSPGITKLSSWTRQSQTEWWIAALHADFQSVPRPKALQWRPALDVQFEGDDIKQQSAAPLPFRLLGDCTAQESLV